MVSPAATAVSGPPLPDSVVAAVNDTVVPAVSARCARTVAAPIGVSAVPV
jgi:hypothetical protein